MSAIQHRLSVDPAELCLDASFDRAAERWIASVGAEGGVSVSDADLLYALRHVRAYCLERFHDQNSGQISCNLKIEFWLTNVQPGRLQIEIVPVQLDGRTFGPFMTHTQYGTAAKELPRVREWDHHGPPQLTAAGSSRTGGVTRVIRPPGAFLERFAAFVFAPKTCDRILRPVISDMQQEYYEALASRQKVKAWWVLLRGRAAFALTVAEYASARVVRRVITIYRMIP